MAAYTKEPLSSTWTFDHSIVDPLRVAHTLLFKHAYFLSQTTPSGISNGRLKYGIFNERNEQLFSVFEGKRAILDICCHSDVKNQT
jgi:hypothetical protein